jgi:hypothetical protein
MSISNLFAPNDYNLFAKTINTGGGDLLTNTIDTIANGDTLLIAPVKAGSVQIGHSGAPMTVNGTGLNLFSSAGNIVIDDSASNAFALFLGNANVASVVIGKVGGFTRVQSPLFLSVGNGSLNEYRDLPAISATGTGCVGSIADFVLLEGYRLNTTAHIRWRFIHAFGPAVCIANDVLTLLQPIPIGLRPTADVVASIAVCKTNVQNTALPGLVRITTAGVVSFELQTVTNAPGFVNFWAAAEFCSIYNGSIEYETV